MSEEVIAEGISLADRMTRLNALFEPTFTDGGHAEGTDGYNNASSFNASHGGQTKRQHYRQR